MAAAFRLPPNRACEMTAKPRHCESNRETVPARMWTAHESSSRNLLTRKEHMYCRPSRLPIIILILLASMASAQQKPTAQHAKPAPTDSPKPRFAIFRPRKLSMRFSSRRSVITLSPGRSRTSGRPKRKGLPKSPSSSAAPRDSRHACSLSRRTGSMPWPGTSCRLGCGRSMRRANCWRKAYRPQSRSRQRPGDYC